MLLKTYGIFLSNSKNTKNGDCATIQIVPKALARLKNVIYIIDRGQDKKSSPESNERRWIFYGLV